MRALENASTFSPRNVTSPDVGSIEPQHAPAGRALAAAGFADEREGLALIDGKAHIVHGADDRLFAEQPAAALEVLDEIADLDERHQPTTLSGTGPPSLGLRAPARSPRSGPSAAEAESREPGAG